MTTGPIQPIFDDPRQLQYVQSQLRPGEHIIAVKNMAGFGFVAITSRRFISQDQTNSKELSMVSIPWSRISSVALFTLQRGMSRIGLEVGQRTYFLEFPRLDAAEFVHGHIVDRITDT